MKILIKAHEKHNVETTIDLAKLLGASVVGDFAIATQCGGNLATSKAVFIVNNLSSIPKELIRKELRHFTVIVYKGVRYTVLEHQNISLAVDYINLSHLCLEKCFGKYYLSMVTAVRIDNMQVLVYKPLNTYGSMRVFGLMEKFGLIPSRFTSYTPDKVTKSDIDQIFSYNEQITEFALEKLFYTPDMQQVSKQKNAVTRMVALIIGTQQKFGNITPPATLTPKFRKEVGIVTKLVSIIQTNDKVRIAHALINCNKTYLRYLRSYLIQANKLEFIGLIVKLLEPPTDATKAANKTKYTRLDHNKATCLRAEQLIK